MEKKEELIKASRTHITMSDDAPIQIISIKLNVVV